MSAQTQRKEEEQRAVIWFQEYFSSAADSPPNGRGHHLDITTKKDIYQG